MTDVYDDWPTDDIDTLDETPPDADTASKYLRWYWGALRDAGDIQATFDTEIERLNERSRDLTAGLYRRADQLRGLLEGYALAVRDATGKATVSLPHGSLSTRAGSERVDVAEAEVLDWLTRSGVDLPITRTTVTVSKADVKTLIQSGALAATGDGQVVIAETGEVVPGLTVITSPVSVTVKAPEARS